MREVDAASIRHPIEGLQTVPEEVNDNQNELGY